MNDIIRKIEQEQLQQDRPELAIGRTVKVHYKIKEGNKERVQLFQGIIIAKHAGKDNLRSTFTVRKVSQGYGIERTFPIHSPKIEKIELLKQSQVRRAKLYFLRSRFGKAARLKERLNA